MAGDAGDVPDAQAATSQATRRTDATRCMRPMYYGFVVSGHGGVGARRSLAEVPVRRAA